MSHKLGTISSLSTRSRWISALTAISLSFMLSGYCVDEESGSLPGTVETIDPTTGEAIDATAPSMIVVPGSDSEEAIESDSFVDEISKLNALLQNEDESDLSLADIEGREACDADFSDQELAIDQSFDLESAWRDIYDDLRKSYMRYGDWHQTLGSEEHIQATVNLELYSGADQKTLYAGSNVVITSVIAEKWQGAVAGVEVFATTGHAESESEEEKPAFTVVATGPKGVILMQKEIKDPSIHVDIPDPYFEVSDSVSYPIMVGPLPIPAEVGAVGGIGIASVDGNIKLREIEVKGTPKAEIKAFAAIGFNIILAKAGVKGDLTMVRLASPVTLTSKSQGFRTSDHPIVTLKGLVKEDIRLMEGRLYAHAMIYYPTRSFPFFDKWSKEKTIFAWEGYKRDDTLGTFNKTWKPLDAEQF